MTRLLFRTLAVLALTHGCALRASALITSQASVADAAGRLRTGTTLRASTVVGQGGGCTLQSTGTTLVQAGFLAAAPLLPQRDADADGIPDEVDPDNDGDGIIDILDACPDNPNTLLAVGDAVTVLEDAPAIIFVTANDVDPNGDPLVVTNFTQPAMGSVTQLAAGTLLFTPPANSNGVASFVYQVSDGACAGGSATVTVTVIAVNDPPIASNDVATLVEDGSVSVNVLANDTDPDGGSLTLVSFEVPTHGSVSNGGGGLLNYFPNPDYSGSDQFRYIVADAGGLRATGFVFLTVSASNDPPVGAVDAYFLSGTNVLTVAAPGLLANDHDVDGDGLSAVAFTFPASGTLAPSSNGAFVYTLANAGVAADGFSYRLTDGIVTSAPITVNIAIDIGSVAFTKQVDTNLVGYAGLRGAELNGDGRVDLVAMQLFGLRWLTNSGAGVFGTRTNLGVNMAWALAVGDVDGDGDADTVVGPAVATGQVTVVMNNGAGGIGRVTNAVGDVHQVRALELADLDGDGDLDLAVGMEGYALGLYVNDGAGNFTLGTNVANQIVDLIQPVDVDGDGDLDLVVQNHGNGLVSVLGNQGGLNFVVRQELNLGFGVGGLGAGDMNGDGRPDVVVGLRQSPYSGSNQRAVKILFNDGHGGLAATQPAFVLTDDFNDADQAMPVALADYDGDGDLDVAMASGPYNGTGRVSFVRNSGGGLLSAPTHVVTSVRPKALVSADVDGDGDPDVAVAHEAGPLMVLLNTTTTAVPVVVSLSPTSGPAGTVVTIGGSNLGFAAAVNFGAATSRPVTVISPTQVVAVVPAGAASGPLTLRTPAGVATGPVFTVTVVTPSLASFSPAAGPALSWVTLRGSGLQGTTNVTLNGTNAAYTVQGATQLLARVPAGTTGGLWQVTGASGSATAPSNFTVRAATLASLQLAATQALGGAALSGRLTLDGVVFTNAVVTLGSDQPSVAGVSNATVAANTTSATFTVNCGLVSATSTARLSAVYAGTTQTVTLVVSPAPAALVGEPQQVRRVGMSSSEFGGDLVQDIPQPTQVQVVDLDGDGLPEPLLMSLNDLGASRRLWAFPNRGGGVLGEPAQYGLIGASLGFLYDVVTGPFDANASADVLALYDALPPFSDGVVMRTNNGTGNLSGSLGQTGVTLAGDPQVLAAGDWDGDGRLDAVAGLATGSQVRLTFLRNTGGGVLTNLTAVDSQIPAGSSSYPLYDLEAGDLDGDGRADVVALLHSRLRVFHNLGGGAFGAGLDEAFFGDARGLSLADLDGDGDLDAAVAEHTTRQLIVLRNDGGVFAVAGVYDVQNPPADVAVADWDGDGRLDVLCCSDTANTVGLLFNLGGGTFGNLALLPMPGTPVRLATADLEGDGDVDVFTANSAGSLGVLVNERNRTNVEWRVRGSDGLSGQNVFFGALRLGDMDTNGWADAVFAANGTDGSRQLVSWSNSGLQALGGPVEQPLGQTPSHLQLQDRDGDGDLDVFSSGINTTTILAGHNRGDGQLTNVATAVSPGLFQDFVVADLNGDAKPDAVALYDHTLIPTLRLQVFTNNGVRMDSATNTYVLTNNVTGAALALVDVDGDADLDAVVSHPLSNLLTVVRNSGNGVFGGAQQVYAVGAFPQQPLAADVDNDGDLDVVVAQRDAGTIGVLRNTGGGNFGALVSYGIGATQVNAVAVGDLDGDGWVDLTAISRLERLAVLLTNDHSGAFAPWRTWRLEGMPVDVQIGPMDAAPGSEVVLVQNVSRLFATGALQVVVGWNQTQLTQTLVRVALATNRAAPGVTVAGQVQLGAPAPAGGVRVYLTASQPDTFATTNVFLTNAVTIAAGATSASFTVAATVNLQNETLVVGARYGADFRTATLAIDPIIPLSLSFAPPAVFGGLTATGTVTINAPAPSGGYSLALSHDAPFGTVSFSPGFGFGIPEGATSATFTVATLPTSNNLPVTITASNLNGTTSAALTILAVPGSVNFTSIVRSVFGAVDLAAGLLDAGTSVDLVALQYFGLFSFTNNSVGGLGFHTNYSLGNFNTDVALADINGDGLGDAVIAAGSAGQVFIRYSAGNGAFPAQTVLSVTSQTARIAMGQFDASTQADLAVGFDSDSRLLVFTNSAGALSQSVSIPLVIANGRMVVAGRLNGDGFDDLVVAGRSPGHLTVLLANGNGTFTSNSHINMASSAVEDIALADMDNDGDQDVVVAYHRFEAGADRKYVMVCPNNGSGVITTGAVEFLAVSDVGGSWFSMPLAVGYFDAGTNLDVALGSGPYSVSGRVSFLLGNGQGLLSAPLHVPVGLRPTALAAADFDRDGDLDLMVGHDGSGIFELRNGLSNLPPIQPVALVFQPPSVTGGNSATGTFFTSVPGRPEASTTFALSAGLGGLSMTSSVELAIGATSATFVVQTIPVFTTSSVPVTVSNVHGDVTQNLFVLPGDLDGDGILDAWELLHFPALTNAAALTDSDGDGVTDAQEYIADTAPTNAQSFLRTLRFSGSSVQQIVFPSATTRLYSVDQTTNLLGGGPWLPLSTAVDMPGNGTNLVVTPTNTLPNAVYRVRARLP